MTTATQVTLNNNPCILPDLSQWPEAERCNSYHCPTGRQWGRAWVLLDKIRMDAMQLSTSEVDLKFTSGGEVTIQDLRLLKATKFTPSPLNAPLGLYLVELVDKRYLLEHFTACNRTINIRKPCHMPSSPGASDTYYSDSLNSGSAYTWATLISTLWGDLGGLGGTAPTLPFTPDGAPEGMAFVGISAWEAIHRVLDKINCTTVYNPVSGAFTIVQVGSTQTGLAAAEGALAAKILDLEPVESDATSIPATIKVIFHRREEFYTDEEQWTVKPVYAKDVATGVTGAVSGTVMVLWDDLTADYDYDGTTLQNSSALDDRAAEIAADWVTAQQDRGGRVYHGVVSSILPGSQVSEVRWEQSGAMGAGIRTTVLKYAGQGMGWGERYPRPAIGNLRKYAIGKLDGTLSQGGSVTVSLWAGAPGSESDTGQNVTAYDWLMKSGATAIASGKKVTLAWVGCKWYVVNAECP